MEKEFEGQEEIDERIKKTREKYEKMDYKKLDDEFWKRAQEARKSNEVIKIRNEIMGKIMEKEGFDWETFIEINKRRDEEEERKRKEAEEKKKAEEELEKATEGESEK